MLLLAAAVPKAANGGDLYPAVLPLFCNQWNGVCVQKWVIGHVVYVADHSQLFYTDVDVMLTTNTESPE